MATHEHPDAGGAADAAVRAALAEFWGLSGAEVAAHHGGMNSATWIVDRGGVRLVAKSVPAGAARDFTGGLAVAGRLQRAGIAAGAPVPARDGRTVVTVAGRPLAVLTWVPGRPLTAGDQPLIGATLARVHRELLGFAAPATQRFHWVDPAAPHLGVRPWVRPAVTAAVRGLAALDPDSLTWGLLHTDPAPEAFRLAGRDCGVIDWSVAMSGPLLYDLASAAMYAGGMPAATPLVEAYLAAAPLTAAEVARGLATMIRFRWAVQADYFARRIVRGDLTGIAGAADNERGLADAERHLGFPAAGRGYGAAHDVPGGVQRR